MKKIFLIALLCILSSTISYSQKIKYDNTSVNLSKLKNDRKNYFRSREILYNADSLLTVGYDIPLSEKEKKVSQYLSLLQRSFIATTGKDFPPSNFFYEGKSMIDTNRVYEILRKMPKGALLHLHPSAGGSAEWVVKNITYMDNCYMYTAQDGNKPYGAMMFFNPDFLGHQKIDFAEVQQKIMEHFLFGVASLKGHKLILKYQLEREKKFSKHETGSKVK